MNDEEIVTSLCNGDNTAFPVLYNRYAARGMQYAHSLLKNRNDSEDAVQEAFCRLLKPVNLGTVNPDQGGFCAMFFGTIRNLSIDMLRKRRFRTHARLDSVSEPTAPSQISGLDMMDREKRVQALLETVQSNHKEALKLKVQAGLSYDQIATVLDCTIPQVRTWIYRARRKLEVLLREEDLIEGKE